MISMHCTAGVLNHIILQALFDFELKSTLLCVYKDGFSSHDSLDLLDLALLLGIQSRVVIGNVLDVRIQLEYL